MNINSTLLNKYNTHGPRYTSYPPATFFSAEKGSNDYRTQVIESNSVGADNISLYFHIPFCNKICHFCGCNSIRKPNETRQFEYVDALIKEMDTVSQLLDKNRVVTQIHWGGGTPNAIPQSSIAKIMQKVQDSFSLSADAEVAMECNPAYLDENEIVFLKEQGFNRISIGIQDFDNKVLEMVNREPSKLPISELTNILKENNFTVNFDFIYGLPGQTVESFSDSVKQAIEINPHRIVTFSYAHVPWVSPRQKALDKYDMPEANEKIEMLLNAYTDFKDGGYVPIGMDHFTLPTDPLAKALHNKKLHRNFQGYTVKDSNTQVYAFGSSAISQLKHSYFQNIKNVDHYIDAVNKTGYAIEKGYVLTQENYICREVITSLMCNKYLDFVSIAKSLNVSVAEIKDITKYDETKLSSFIDDKFITIEGDELFVTEKGSFFIRNIAMLFDPLLDKSTTKYSKTI